MTRLYEHGCGVGWVPVLEDPWAVGYGAKEKTISKTQRISLISYIIYCVRGHCRDWCLRLLSEGGCEMAAQNDPYISTNINLSHA